jgi:histone H1/5
MADTTAAKPKKSSAHPKYSEMETQAINILKERRGSSRQAILKYVMANFKVGKDAKLVNDHLDLALGAGVKNKSLRQSKGTGGSGSFKIGDREVKAAKKPAKAKKAAKPKAVKPKKAAGEKNAQKPSTKKAAAKPKKTKTSAKPKATKSPKKK